MEELKYWHFYFWDEVSAFRFSHASLSLVILRTCVRRIFVNIVLLSKLVGLNEEIQQRKNETHTHTHSR